MYSSLSISLFLDLNNFLEIGRKIVLANTIIIAAVNAKIILPVLQMTPTEAVHQIIKKAMDIIKI